MQRGVYAAFTGRPQPQGELWAVLLRAGPEAVLSHQSAAEMWDLLNGPGPVVHVTVPHGSNPERCGQIPGVVVHRSRSLQRARHPVLTPPRTRSRRRCLTSSTTHGASMRRTAGSAGPSGAGGPRPRASGLRLRTGRGFQWRQDVEVGSRLCQGGALSVLELRYTRGVERPHGLPTATRQARVRHATGHRYLTTCMRITALA